MRNKRLSAIVRSGAALGFSLLAVLGCSDNRSASTSLEVAKSTPAPNLSAEKQWLHSLQMVTVVDDQGNATEDSPDTFDSVVDDVCKAEFKNPLPIFSDPTLGDLTTRLDCKTNLELSL